MATQLAASLAALGNSTSQSAPAPAGGVTAARLPPKKRHRADVAARTDITSAFKHGDGARHHCARTPLCSCLGLVRCARRLPCAHQCASTAFCAMHAPACALLGQGAWRPETLSLAHLLSTRRARRPRHGSPVRRVSAADGIGHCSPVQGPAAGCVQLCLRAALVRPRTAPLTRLSPGYVVNSRYMQELQHAQAEQQRRIDALEIENQRLRYFLHAGLLPRFF